ncbi:YdcF family protein [Candidatus Uhrbacteria bacterium]|nr:YdcF family protein [Candidatus Uhrbacteria bacterium]
MTARIIILFLIGISVYAISMVRMTQDAYIYPSIAAIPQQPIALVLGASIRNGTPSTILTDRLDTARQLYETGKVKKLIVSGDNREEYYNEPAVMKEYLVERGVPPENVVADYAGRRTYDSCYRLKEIFGQQAAILVTQRYHLVRAIYLCRNLGVASIGIAADRSRYANFIEAYLRDIAASLKAWLDIVVLKPTPILGKQEKVF